MYVVKFMKYEYKNLKKENCDKIVFIKSGCFYYCYDDDSYIINYIFKYKIIGNKIAFPVNKLNSVCKKLEDYNIGFVCEDKVFEGSNYDKYLKLSLDNVKKDMLIKEINFIISKLDYKKLYQIMVVVSKYE